MKIANIVTNNKVDVTDDINVVSSIEDIIPDVPTLVTSYEWLKDNYDDYDIYDKKLDNNLYWTFAKTERRDVFNKDVDEFITLANRELVEDIDYVFLDLIQFHPTTINKIIRKIFSIEDIISFKYKDMIYIYGDKLIFGIDLYLIKYMGFDENRVEMKIKNISKEFLEGDEIFILYKDNMERLNNSVKYIPFLCAMKNE
jgi:hypothetical protein